ncbi:MAG: sodium:solute symporter family protein [Eubacteriales bacterium]|nr:sodium:solute symporter family protein [Eubacteriales bacterium]
MNVGLIILVIYMIAILGLAIYASKKDKKTIADFATADSSLGVFVLTLTFSATYHSAYAFLGAPGFVYTHGIGWWANGIWTVFPGILFWLIGRRFWLLGKRHGYLSLSEYMSDAYDSNLVGLLVTLITMVFTVPYIAMQAIGSGYIFDTISNGALSYEVGTIIFFVIMIALVWLGGMKGVSLTDAAQGVFMWVGLVIGSFIIIKGNYPSVSAAYTEAFKVIPEHFTLPGPQGLITGGDWISRWVVITIGMMMFPHVTLRFFSGKSLRVLKWSSVFSSIYLTSIYVFIPAIGMAGHLLMPGLANADTILPELLLKYTPMVFAALVISGALAASMSTGDSQLHAVGSMLATDVYKKYVNKDASEQKQYHVAKVCILILGVISVIVALIKPGLLGNILALSNGGVASLAPAVLGGIYYKKASKEAAIASIITGEVAMLLTTFVIPSPLGLMPGLWGLIVSIIVYFATSRFTNPSERAVELISEINDFFYANN